MLTKLGKRSVESPSMADRLLDCHARIRHYCALALRLVAGGPETQTREAAEQLHRYFSVALPLHTADEDQSVRPRLERLGDATVSAALGAMTAEHAALAPTLEELLERWLAIAGDPSGTRCLDTQRAAEALERHMLAHLGDEEALVIPALGRLSRTEADAIVTEMQARRRP